jgi:hypothetical protein
MAVILREDSRDWSFRSDRAFAGRWEEAKEYKKNSKDYVIVPKTNKKLLF